MRTKQELIDALSERTGQSKKDTADFVDSLAHLARECLAEGREVILPAIGKLTVKEKKARMGRNPQWKVPPVGWWKTGCLIPD